MLLCALVCFFFLPSPLFYCNLNFFFLHPDLILLDRADQNTKRILLTVSKMDPPSPGSDQCEDEISTYKAVAICALLLTVLNIIVKLVLRCQIRSVKDPKVLSNYSYMYSNYIFCTAFLKILAAVLLLTALSPDDSCDFTLTYPFVCLILGFLWMYRSYKYQKLSTKLSVIANKNNNNKSNVRSRQGQQSLLSPVARDSQLASTSADMENQHRAPAKQYQAPPQQPLTPAALGGSVPGNKFCMSCGTALPPGAKFCGGCGAKT